MKFPERIDDNLLVCERSPPQGLYVSETYLLHDITKVAGESLVSCNAADPSDFLNNFFGNQQRFLVKYKYKHDLHSTNFLKKIFLTINTVAIC